MICLSSVTLKIVFPLIAAEYDDDRKLPMLYAKKSKEYKIIKLKKLISWNRIISCLQFI